MHEIVSLKANQLFWVSDGLREFARDIYFYAAFPLFLSKVAGNLPIFVVYIGKSILPVQLSVAPKVTTALLMAGVGVLAMLSGLLWVSRERKFGNTADFARDGGEDIDSIFVVAGMRLWF